MKPFLALIIQSRPILRIKARCYTSIRQRAAGAANERARTDCSGKLCFWHLFRRRAFTLRSQIAFGGNEMNRRVLSILLLVSFGLLAGIVVDRATSKSTKAQPAKDENER